MLSPVICLLYFVAGFGAAVLTGFGLASRERDDRSKSRRWESIENLLWTFDYDAEFPTERSANEIGLLIGGSMQEVLKKRPLPPIQIKPGNYTVRMRINASFVRRNPLDEPPRTRVT